MDITNKGSQYRILVIDDNPEIHKDFNKILAFRGFESTEMDKDELLLFEKTEKIFSPPRYLIEAASQGEEGLNMIKKSLKENNPYAVMFVDIRMPPGWDGIETIQKIWSVDDQIQTVICTAYSDYSWGDIYNKFGETDRLLVLKKPFDNLEVRQFTSTLTKKWELNQQVNHQLDFLQKTVDEKTMALREALSLLRATFESTADGILVVNTKNEIIDFNKKFSDIWQVPTVILESRKIASLIAFMTNQLEQPGSVIKILQNAKREEKSFDLLKFKNKKIMECYSQPQEMNGKVIGKVWSFRDITQRKSLEEKLIYQASHDILTGLNNRISFLKQIDEDIQQETGEKKQAAILFFNLDHFKLINDSLGHSLGDNILKMVSNRIRQCTRPSDGIARLGGDEFVIFIKNLSNDSEIKRIVQRFFDAIKKPFEINENTLNITMSGGVSLYPQDGQTSEVLLKNAGAAMYRAKEKGRNNFQYYTPSMNDGVVERLELSNDLNQALEKKEFTLYYQPLLNVKSQKIIGTEALIRWNHPKKGFLSPIDFIPLAEETGLIIPIGEWALITACKQVKSWHNEYLPKIWVAVNLSVNQFKQGNIVATVDKALRESGLEAKYLCLEITENLMLEDNTELREIMLDLKTRGVRLSIDDFGVGYSNLNYITRFPIDKLKIDKSFIRDVTTNAHEAAIVMAILGIAKGLNMEVLAEGVETKEQLDFLRENQCDEFQGFLASKPVDARSFREILDLFRNSQLLTDVGSTLDPKSQIQ